jgi:hypothetical protein
MEIDNYVVYPNVQYSTWDDQRFLHIYADSLNFSSSDLISSNICNNSSFVQLNDTDENNNVHEASGVRNR